ncbi:MAG: PA14 domain-containing protein [Chitinophagaceae bacterium]
MIINFFARYDRVIALGFYLILCSEIAAASGNSMRYRNYPRFRASTAVFDPVGRLKDSPADLPAAPTLGDQLPPAPPAIPPTAESAFGGGGQPEMQAFQSANANEMVDLFSGDFSYNIPLLDVGGYPINISYRGGISMDQEASWVGLGWNINPGTVSRNLRGLPDDFKGEDSIRKITSIRENKTVGVTAGGDFEVTGLPLPVTAGASIGVFHNNYRGWGIENALNASLNSGTGAKGPLSGGLSLTNNTQEGFTIAPSISLKLGQLDEETKAGTVGSFSLSLPYNSRAGLRGLQTSVGIRQYKNDDKNQSHSAGEGVSSTIAFASPTYTPTITMPYTSRQFSFTGKVGAANMVFHPNFFISGYVSKQKIDAVDTLISLPAYGYLHAQEGARNRGALHDFNREKEVAYRDRPPVPHIAVPFYTYDAFSITGEGTGGMFRAYRGDIGMVYDHFIRTKDASDRLSVDIGLPNLVHAGFDLNINRSFTQNGPWLNENAALKNIDFRDNKESFEAVYFRNPGEKSVNSKSYYEQLGGDDVVTLDLSQAGSSSSSILATNYLTRYKNKRPAGKQLLTPQNSTRGQRDKRSQVISYLSAKEAGVAGLTRYIENYTVNQFGIEACGSGQLGSAEGPGTGLPAEYFRTRDLKGVPDLSHDNTINYNWAKNAPYAGFPSDDFSIRWKGRLKAPVSGAYTFTARTDDGVRLWLNDSLVINQWTHHGATDFTTTLNLLANETYTIRMEYFEGKSKAVVQLSWAYPGQVKQIIPQTAFYPPVADSFYINPQLVREARNNAFRKSHHISEVTVLNQDGRRHVYGLPVYNLRQKEATFAVNPNRKNEQTGLVGYTSGQDNTTQNSNGKDNYFSSEEVPPYAHSFLLTGLLSPDYLDVTGDGITEDDPGDAIKFNYSKVAGLANPYKWRAPQVTDSVTYNPGLKTDNRDDKGNYLYGEKELWYLHSVVSKTMIATFVLEGREDQLALDERGMKIKDGKAKRLKEIRLFTKSEFLKNPEGTKPVKTVHFEYSYELCRGINRPVNDSGKLTLKKIWFTYYGNTKGKMNPYVFHYSNLNPSYNLKSYDRWGNYKDPLQNPGSSPANLITNAEYPYTLRDSVQAARNVTAWMMDSIGLPSGGSIKIDFESDDYGFVQNKRAMGLFKLAGFASAPNLLTPTARLYDDNTENLYLYIKLPKAAGSLQQARRMYLDGISKLFFRVNVKMPSDASGAGAEYISGYTDFDQQNGVGLSSPTLLWVKMNGLSLKGDGPGGFSPIVKAASQFLRMNLPSKAYPGSENNDQLDLDAGIKMLLTLATNIKDAFSSFDRIARGNIWVSEIDTSRSYVKLNEPAYKKLGGGHRVKRATLYDKWDKMTGQRAATYGREYIYNKSENLHGVPVLVSSGVAAYEPGIGGEENPFRQPIEYVEKVSALGPVTLGYSEEPLGESLFPAAGVGYSQVRVRSIHYTDKKSANGFAEHQFYTFRDFPVLTDRSILDADTKKRYKPALANLLKINARHFVSLSQGFKIELNDMHGKPKATADYAETDHTNPLSYSQYYYHVENNTADEKKLANTVYAVNGAGIVDSAALIGKDMELMVDMREQLSVSNGYNLSVNTDMFAVPFLPPFFLIPSLLNLAQREENRFRSVGITKVIQRFGIVDSVVVMDKGSRISTENLLFDAETGAVVMTRTKNDFGDPVFKLNYPAHWAYPMMGMAYQNIDFNLKGVTIRGGLITSPLPAADTILFVGGDEVLVSSKMKTGELIGGNTCQEIFSSFSSSRKIWVVDSSQFLQQGRKAIYFVDERGLPFNGHDITLRVIRSGRRNMTETVGSILAMNNPVIEGQGGQLRLSVTAASKVVDATATEFRQNWLMPAYKCEENKFGCPVGYAEDQYGNCTKVTDTAVIHYDSATICLTNNYDANYTACGSFIYNSNYTSFSRIDSNNFWFNVYGFTGGACQSTPSAGAMKAPMEQFSVADSSGSSQQQFKSNGQLAMSVLAAQADSVIGPLNRSGVWLCQPGGNTGVFQPLGQWIVLNDSFSVPSTKTYYLGLGVDNDIKVYIDGNLISQKTGSGLPNFEIWYIYPISLTAGSHTIRIEGLNTSGIALMGVEIYNNTEAQLRAAKCYSGCANSLNMVFSTRDMIGKTYPVSHQGCPIGYSLTGGSTPVCRRTQYASKVWQVSPVPYNPYSAAVAGNWRPSKTYTYFARRSENDPTTATDIRRDGTYQGFTGFWHFFSGQLRNFSDTSKWAWNKESTLFNRRGLEIENRDPVGRYNSGLYGYNFSVPTAIAQNSRYRDIAYDGFEDYDFGIPTCDTCSNLKHLDFTPFKSFISKEEQHTGTASLRLPAGQGVALTVPLTTSAIDGVSPRINTEVVSDNCPPRYSALKSVTADSTVRQQEFTPRRNQSMVVGVWVKEDQECNCASYTQNRLVISFSNSSTNYTLLPSGGIIDGWQRYEHVFQIPSDADSMTVSFESTGTGPVYFDDLRLHPLNANMTSMVHNPENLRMMAELNEHNFATFYEYDDDGNLIRVKMETYSGIRTVKETRSALTKE